MRQNVIRMSALLAVLAAACSEPTSINQGLAVPASPGLTVTTTGGQLNISDGNNEIATASSSVGFTYHDPVVQLLDANSAPIVGATVTFTPVAVAGVTTSSAGYGGACGAAGSTVTATTNAAGLAVVRWCFKAIGGQSMTASISDGTSVTFNGIATTNGGVPTITQSANGIWWSGTMAGQATVGGNPYVTVTDAGSAAALPGVLLSWTPNGDGTVSSSSTRTNAGGVSSVVWTLRTVTTSASTLTIATTSYISNGTTATPAVFTLTPKARGTTMAVVMGGFSDTATTTANSKFGPRDPAVQITTDGTTPVGAGVAVGYTYGALSNACGQIGTYQTYAFTNAAGVVAMPWCNDSTLTATGTRTITFTAGTLTQTITGTVKNDLSGGGSTALTANTGPMTGAVGSTATPDLAATFTDKNGIPVVGKSVTFTASAGTVAFNGTSGTAITVTTNASGQASVRWTFGTTVGAQTVTATTTSPSTTVTFNGTASVGAAARIFIVQGDGLTGTKNTNSPKDPTVKVTDQYNNTITGSFDGATCTGGQCVDVTFAVTAGGGSVTNAVVTTGIGAPGNAGTAWKLGPTAGTNTLTATILNGQFVTFNVVGQ